MDTLSSHTCRSIQSYWRRRGDYDRLDGVSASKNRRPTARLGGGSRSGRRVRVFRLVIGRVKLIPSPKKLLGRLRDAYVNGMLSWSGSSAPTTKKKRISKSKDHEIEIGELEMRMIMNIYNTVTANPREVRMISYRAETDI